MPNHHEGRQTGPAAAAVAPARPAGLLAKLVAAVRPDFRRDELAFDADDPVFGGPACRVPACVRPARGLGMCNGHHLRWATAGKPDLAEFTATTAPHFRRPPPRSCRAADCGYGVARAGLCPRHGDAWRRAGQPELAGWLAGLPPATPASPPPACPLPGCGLWAQGATPYCRAHGRSWVALGRPDPAEFLLRRQGTGEALPAYERIDLGGLPAQLKLEMQYALQCRYDDKRVKTRPSTVRGIVRFLAASRVASLLDWPEQEWKLRFPAPSPKRTTQAALLVSARRRVEELAFGRGWDVEYPRDVWRLRNLGLGAAQDTHATVRFDRIPQPWLAEPAKRWMRLRLSTGAVGGAWAYQCATAVTAFAAFLTTAGVGSLAGVDRAVLERYLAHLRTGPAGTQPHRTQIGHLNGLFSAVRRHGWDDTLPASAVFFPEDYPKPAETLPRALAEHVMAQVEHPANLDRWGDPARKLATVILIRCGLRVSDALRLPFDCITCDSGGAPYLRYYNHKMKRDALVPIDAELQRMVAEQQRHVLHQWPGGTPVLFPRRTANIDGSRPTSSGTYREALYRWLRDCGVRDEHGRPVHLTPHQWRHTLGTRMINRDVPQEVVRRILDHDSPDMTAHYARLHDTTVRRHWEQARKVNVDGDAVTLDPGGPLAEAAWAKQRLSRATQALPNGYCGLPVQQSCPHANACLTCPTFITTAEFLPQHREQHRQTLQIISAAEAGGRRRLAEMNRRVAGNLEKIITALEDDGEQEAAAGAS